MKLLPISDCPGAATAKAFTADRKRFSFAPTGEAFNGLQISFAYCDRTFRLPLSYENVLLPSIPDPRRNETRWPALGLSSPQKGEQDLRERLGVVELDDVPSPRYAQEGTPRQPSCQLVDGGSGDDGIALTAHHQGRKGASKR